jgi:hypothetical protein
MSVSDRVLMERLQCELDAANHRADTMEKLALRLGARLSAQEKSDPKEFGGPPCPSPPPASPVAGKFPP